MYFYGIFIEFSVVDVWKESSPLTPEEIIELDKYCKEKFVELVPNQQVLGNFVQSIFRGVNKKISKHVSLVSLR